MLYRSKHVTHLVDDPSKRARSVGTREDMLVHEKTPDEILILPRWTDTSNLEDKDTIVVQKVVDLGKELGVATDTDVLGHLQADNLVILGALGDFTVIAAEDTSLVRGDLKTYQ